MEFLTAELIKAVLGGALLVMGWFLRQLWDMVKELKNDLGSLKDQINREYVRRDDFKDVKDSIMSALSRIESKLDTKVDK